MKTKRSLLAVAITLAAAACSGDATAPDPSFRDGAAFEESSTATTSPPVPAVTEPEPKEDDGGLVGSGVGR